MLSINSSITESYDINENKTNLLFGIHEVCKSFYPNFDSDKVIIFNTEQLSYSSDWVNINYITALKTYRVIDYCHANKRWLKSELDINADIFYFGHYPIYKNVNLDIDVLFYGTYTEGRWKVYESIKHLPLIIRFEKEVWGEEKENIINRSRIILNLHRYSTNLLPIVKLFTLISSGKVIISERCSDEDDYLGYPIIFCDINQMASTIMSCIRTWHTS